jgi:hypothetical protein
MYINLTSMVSIYVIHVLAIGRVMIISALGT